ncbi:hypothetical protein HDU79_010622 [Rhizoclosmatium sp. JEL0117]|nr:hypothetical protein HDU79_010622 [Rhizoclosmatium sp. JEL0117]
MQQTRDERDGAIDDILNKAQLKASSEDTTSPGCENQKCSVDQVFQINSRTAWQSAADTSCAPQWIKATLSEGHAVYSFSIQYGSLEPPPSVNQPNSNTLVVPEFMFMLQDKAGSLLDVTKSLACGSKVVNGTTIDVCKISWDDTTVATAASKAYGCQWTWTLSPKSAGKPCQMNIEEIILTGSVAGDGAQATSTSGPTLPLIPANPSMGSGNGQTQSQSQDQATSIGAIIGYVILALVIGAVGGILFVRKRNLERRKRARRLLAENNQLNRYPHDETFLTSSR